MTGIEAPRIRLRPGVAVTPLRAGLHLRGRDGSVTLEGSRGLPLLWELLAERLGEEDNRGGKEDPAHPANTSHRADRPRPRLDPADPRVESALAALTAQLRAHDLLAECPAHRTCPAGVAEPAPWLGASTYRPGPAAAALAAARPVVAAADPAGPLATALISALERAGTRPQVHRDTGLPTDRVMAAAEVRASPVAVAVGRTAGGGFVTAPADPGRARSDAESIAARLSPGSSSGSGPQSGSASSGTTSPTAAAPAALTALLAGAAAQRLLCAVAGLPDPAVREEDPLLLPDRPAVLVAEARPPHASYHPWLTGPVDPAAPSPSPAGDLGEALRRIGALGDPHLGVLDAPRPGRLPQLPAALATCRTPAGPLVAGAPRADLARLTAACRAAELHLGDGTAGPVAVGAGPEHALGRALRRAAVAAVATTGCSGPGHVLVRALNDEEWLGHPQTRHWWTVLTRHLELPMEMTIHQLGLEQAYFAVVRNPAAQAGTAGAAARAVEATPADAAAMAALGAVTRATAAEYGPAGAVHTAFSGAEAPLASAGVEPAAWTDEGWTDRWLAGVARREPELRTALARLTGLSPESWQPGAADLTSDAAGRPAGPVGAALHACGFTALAGWGGGR
ncbi:hypothetical protein [Streptomyces sp. NBC_00272]|uniref:hypothetical protein n=1 Tax=Streptomyces sp. NBC_00272 TaxID=2975698 RepID=UPI002E2BA1B3|nr:hypothetical protein [Streptomyces sp. NBC_00272]